ncbi:MAG: alpha/beta hydrolase [Sulfuricurvum sp.]|nr:alpha/beta hydrolase [Sulfuricurvum sp.]
MKYNMIFLSILIMIGFSGCSTVLEPKITTVDDRNVEYYLKQTGSQTVVFENGLGGTMKWWSDVISGLDNNVSVFAYNRAGYGNSSSVSSERDGERIVEELRALLKRNKLCPPYILVGHSLGGLYMQYYARKYPEEVSGLVLVDSTHPNQFRGNGDPEKWPFLTKTIFNLLLSETAETEFDAINKTGNEVLALPTATSMPIIILSALEPMSVHSELADDANAKRIDLANLYPNAEVIWVDSGHVIPYEKPESVIEAIKSIQQRNIK